MFHIIIEWTDYHVIMGHNFYSTDYEKAIINSELAKD